MPEPTAAEWDLTGGAMLPEAIAGRIVWQLRQGRTVTVRLEPGSAAEAKLRRLFRDRARETAPGVWEITD